MAGALIEDNSTSELFDRSLIVNGIKIVIAGEVGGQKAVPDSWALKIARLIQLITDPNYDGIDRGAKTHDQNLKETQELGMRDIPQFKG